MDPLGLILAAALGASGYALGRQGKTPELRRLQEAIRRSENGLEEVRRQLVAIPLIDAKRIEELEKASRGQDLQLALHSGVQEGLEQQAKENREHTVGLTRDTLALGTEIKERLQALEDELDARFNAVSERQDEVLEALAQQLTAMQSFIVQAAEEAQQRRQALERQNNLGAAVMAAGGGTAESNAETERILALQAEAQREFIRRRRAAAAAAIPAPNGQGAGL